MTSFNSSGSSKGASEDMDVPAWRKGGEMKWWKVVAREMFITKVVDGERELKWPKRRICRGWAKRVDWVEFKGYYEELLEEGNIRVYPEEEGEEDSLLRFEDWDGHDEKDMPKKLKGKAKSWYLYKAVPIVKKQNGKKMKNRDVEDQERREALRALGVNLEPRPDTYCLTVGPTNLVKSVRNLTLFEKHSIKEKAEKLEYYEDMTKKEKEKIKSDFKFSLAGCIHSLP